MQLTFELNLDPAEVSRLASILRCDEANLAAKLEPYARAAMKEYVQMFLGKRVMRQASDVREQKLLLLIQEAFNNEIPDERKICKLFQVTPSQSRSLIRSVMSKYQYELETAINQSYVKVLQNCRQIEATNNYEVTIDSSIVAEGLNQLLAGINGKLPKIMRKTGTVSVYRVDIASYQHLHTELNISQ